MQFHINPDGDWTRCVASTPDACPFKHLSHGDRTDIAVQHGGGVVQDSAAREALITPVVGGVYAVFPGSGDARTYTDKGELIQARNRPDYFNKTILPKLVAGGGSAFDRRVRSLMTEQTVRDGDKELKQWVLPKLEFNDKDDTVVIRRAAPIVAGPTPARTPPATTTKATPLRATPSTSGTQAPQQSAKAVAKAKAQAKADKKARRRKVVKHCRRAVKMGKAYNRQMNKVVGAKSSSKTDDFMDGFLSWFFELFDVK